MLRLPDGSVSELRGRGSPPVGILPVTDFPVHRVEVTAGQPAAALYGRLIERRGDTDLEAGWRACEVAVGNAPPGRRGASSCWRAATTPTRFPTTWRCSRWRSARTAPTDQRSDLIRRCGRAPCECAVGVADRDVGDLLAGAVVKPRSSPCRSRRRSSGDRCSTRSTSTASRRGGRACNGRSCGRRSPRSRTSSRRRRDACRRRSSRFRGGLSPAVLLARQVLDRVGDRQVGDPVTRPA